jgi:hypothetical protein
MRRQRLWGFCLVLLAQASITTAAVAEESAALADQQAAREAAQLRKFNTFTQETFRTTQRSVEARLRDLDEKANHLFDQGTEIALAAMTSVIEERTGQYKLEHARSSGPILRLKELFLGLPVEVDQIYTDGKKQFEQDMKALAVRVAIVVAAEVDGAKNEIKAAQAKIASAQAKLPASIKARALKQRAEYAKKFAKLEARGYQSGKGTP